MIDKNKQPAERDQDEDKKFPLPVYKKEDDIYSRDKEVSLDEALPSGKNKIKVNNALTTGSDLDIPGSELDDANEAIGEEDEENNYYSLGGDNHEDLEEDRS